MFNSKPLKPSVKTGSSRMLRRKWLISRILVMASVIWGMGIPAIAMHRPLGSSGIETGTVDYGPQTGNPGTGYDAVGNRRSRVVIFCANPGQTF
jgi:hypothetical protein